MQYINLCQLVYSVRHFVHSKINQPIDMCRYKRCTSSLTKSTYGTGTTGITGMHRKSNGLHQRRGIVTNMPYATKSGARGTKSGAYDTKLTVEHAPQKL